MRARPSAMSVHAHLLPLVLFLELLIAAVGPQSVPPGPPRQLDIPRLFSPDGALNEPLFVQRPSNRSEVELYTLQYIPGPGYMYGLFCTLSQDGGRSFPASPSLVMRLPVNDSETGDPIVYLSPARAAVDAGRRQLHIVMLTTAASVQYTLGVAHAWADDWPPLAGAGQLPSFTPHNVVVQVLPAGTNRSTGAVMRSFIRSGSGRLIFPWFFLTTQHGSMVPPVPPFGDFNATAVFTDDGTVWRQSSSSLAVPTAYPCAACDGGVEPTLVELPRISPAGGAGVLWMLIRTETGRLWQSESTCDGDTWSAPRPTGFVSSDSPPALLRLANEQVLLLWNNGLRAFPSPNETDYVTRNVLHAAVATCASGGGSSSCRWQGFREVRHDPLLAEAAAHHDYGVAYPWPESLHGPDDSGGHAVVTSGQGLGRSAMFTVDAAWLEQTSQTANFSDRREFSGSFFIACTGDFFSRPRPCNTSTGLINASSVSNAGGNTSTGHADGNGWDGKSGEILLSVGGDKGANGAGGATWNFPALGKGFLRLELSDGNRPFGGCVLSLTDFFSSPQECHTDAAGHIVGCEVLQETVEAHALFVLTIPGSASTWVGAGNGTAAAAAARQILFEWALSDTGEGGANGNCTVTIDTMPPIVLPQQRTANEGGVSYLRMRSLHVGGGALLVRSIQTHESK